MRMDCLFEAPKCSRPVYLVKEFVAQFLILHGVAETLYDGVLVDIELARQGEIIGGLKNFPRFANDILLPFGIVLNIVAVFDDADFLIADGDEFTRTLVEVGVEFVTEDVHLFYNGFERDYRRHVCLDNADE